MNFEEFYMPKSSFKEKVALSFFMSIYLLGVVAWFAYLGCFFYYPSFFWVTIATVVVMFIATFVIDTALNGMYENWGFHGMMRILLPGLVLYLVLFCLLWGLKRLGVVDIEMKWLTLSLLGITSIALASLVGGIIMWYENKQEEKRMAKLWEDRRQA